MASDFPVPHDFSEINLAEYYPQEQGYNSVVYIHKKFLKKSQKQCKERDASKEQSPAKIPLSRIPEKIRGNQGNRGYRDRLQRHTRTDAILVPSIQTPPLLRNTTEKRKPDINHANQDSVIEQTVKFVKNIVPLCIPQNNTHTSPVLYYSVKTSKKDKNTTSKHDKQTQHELHHIPNAPTYGKRNLKPLIETFRKENCVGESSSMRETPSQSSNSHTIEDSIHSLALSLSEISEKKQFRHTPRDHREKHQREMKKLFTSDSLEALGNEISRTTGGGKVKIHLMNDKDKAIFSESIRTPVIKAIAHCVEVLIDKCNVDQSELKAVHKKVQNNSEKLDTIIKKLTWITDNLTKVVPVQQNNPYPSPIMVGREYYVSPHSPKNKTPNTTPRAFEPKMGAVKPPENKELTKASTLEAISQDLPEIKEDIFEKEELYQKNVFEKMYVSNENEVRAFSPIHITKDHNRTKFSNVREENCIIEEMQGPPMEGPLRTSQHQPTGSCNRIPTRYCWTGTANNSRS